MIKPEQLIEVLNRVRGEPNRAYSALVDYAKQGGGYGEDARRTRSLRELARMYRNMAKEGFPVPTRRQTTLQGWSVRYEWQARVEAWDAKLVELAAGEWLQRREEFRLAAWEDGERLRRVGRQWLRQLETAGEATAGAAAKLLEAAAALQTQALGRGEAGGVEQPRLSEADEAVFREMYGERGDDRQRQVTAWEG